ncbi:hypothetical protein [Acinetobacter sp. MD2(2019)]|uniref:hypothetical protein n=1 Tax=Acinetobacter sp. MD2(2019) TaxID=2605273 RepID=UPI002D1F4637|nr:hypothetical protein [Acinetobacter sp. MD2(2019)]MEB3755041.1 hypothetical protein [Acinetobacter sp. MD2(2019)]
MNLPCPYCQSRDTVLLESPQHLPTINGSSAHSNEVMSPLALAGVGMSLSKSLNIPPLAGALAGVFIAGIWLIMTDGASQSHPNQVYCPLYYCNDCDRDFSPSIRN